MDPSSNRLWTHHCSFFTLDARITGHLNSRHRRLLDALNETTLPFLTVQDSHVAEGFDGGRITATFVSSLLRRSDILLCQRLDPVAPPPRDSAGAPERIRRERVLIRTTVDIGGILLRGDTHLPPNTTLARHLNTQETNFVLMSDVHLVWAGGELTMPQAYVNVSRASAFHVSVESDYVVLGSPVPAPADKHASIAEARRPAGVPQERASSRAG